MLAAVAVGTAHTAICVTGRVGDSEIAVGQSGIVILIRLRNHDALFDGHFAAVTTHLWRFQSVLVVVVVSSRRMVIIAQSHGMLLLSLQRVQLRGSRLWYDLI